VCAALWNTIFAFETPEATSPMQAAEFDEF
jgi:hypothetical protein